MGMETPKQLLRLEGVTIIERTLKPFLDCPDVEGIVISAGENSIEAVAGIVSAMHTGAGMIKIVPGGIERQESVLNGLKAISDGVDIAVIHDAVRPFIRASLIGECVRSAGEYGAVSVMRPLKETVKVVKNGIVEETPDRSSLWITQTPQAFQTALILEAHERACAEGFTGTDDCMLVERIGHPVRIIEGDDLNIKITTPADLKMAGAILHYFESGGNNAENRSRL